LQKELAESAPNVYQGHYFLIPWIGFFCVRMLLSVLTLNNATTPLPAITKSYGDWFSFW